MKLWGRFISFTLALILVGSSGAALAAPTTGIYGKVVDNQNAPIANTVITASQNGSAKYTARTAADGSYSIPAAAGAYSLSYVPPTSANGTLKAYDIVSPMANSLTVMLTTPTPGRAFVTGNISLSSGEALATDSYVSVATAASGSISTNGDFRMMPTAGSTGTWGAKVANKASLSIQLIGQNQTSINQDTYANIVIPVTQQRIRVVTSTGTPVAGARLYGGVGTYSTPAADIKPLEGLGAFKAAWKNAGTTDANGWMSLTAVQYASASQGYFMVTPPAGYMYDWQDYTVPTGNGDITLTLTKQSSQINGVIKDLSGNPVSGLDISFGDRWTTTDVKGAYAMAIPNGTVGNFSMRLSSGISSGPLFATNFVPQIGAATQQINGVTTQNFTLPFETTTVKVLDSSGAPVVNANVRLTDDNGYAPRALATLLPGRPAFTTGFQSIGFTDSKGVVVLRTTHFDKTLTGYVIVTPATGSPLAWNTTTATVGAGAPITVTLPRPSVNLSGKISYSDGTPIGNTSLTFSAGNGGDQGTAIPAADGSFSMKVPAGMKGQFWFNCQPQQGNLYPDFFCPSFVAGQSTINADTVRNIVIPAQKTPVHVVDPNGKGIPNISILFNTGMISPSCQGRVSIFPGEQTMMGFISRATTDANGWVQVPTIKYDRTCQVYVLLNPDADSRYPTRNLQLTIGDGATNLIVLTIPEPSIASTAVNTYGTGTNTSKVMTLVGDNFLGVFGVTFNGVAITKFSVVDKTHITFTLPSSVTTGTVTVTNGGGTASIVAR
jgi:hypothetical protein